MADSSPWWRRRPGRPGDAPPGAAESAAPASPGGDATPAPEGRVLGPRGERTKTIAVRLTSEEHAAWRAAAAADGRSQMGRWVRETITDRLAGRQGPKQIEGMKELRSDLSHAGSNLNQIARALNVAQRGGGDPPELQVVAQVIDATRQELARVRNAIQELS